MALTAPNVIGENSAATPGLWNSPITTLWQDILALQSSHTGLISTNTISPESGNTILVTSSVLSTSALRSTTHTVATNVITPIVTHTGSLTLNSGGSLVDITAATQVGITAGTGEISMSAGTFIELTSGTDITLNAGADLYLLAVDEVFLEGSTVAVAGFLQTTLTTEQLRLRYDALNYMSVTVGSTGGVTFNATGTGASFTFSDAVTLSAALTYGGVTLANAVTGTGNMVLSASPTFTGTVTIAAALVSGLTASQAVFTDGSKNLVSNAITGSGNVVMSASPTLTGTITAAIANFSGLVTANAGLTVASGQTLTITGATITGLTAASVGAGTFPSGSYAFTGATTLTGGAGNMTIVAGTGNSRTLILQGTSSGGVATTNVTLTDTTAVWNSIAHSGITTLAGTGAVSGFTSYASSRIVDQYQTTWASTSTVITGGVYLGTNGTLLGLHLIATSNHGMGFAVNNGAPALIISNAGAFDFRSNPVSGVTTLAMGGALSGVTTAAMSGLITSTATTGIITSATATATPSAYSATAAMFLASTVSGATLMGFGTTGDVTLKNRAGNDVLIVLANTLNTELKGTLLVASNITQTAGTAALQTVTATTGTFVADNESITSKASSANGATYLAFRTSAAGERGYVGFATASSSTMSLWNDENDVVKVGTNNVLAATFAVGGGLTLVGGLTATTVTASGLIAANAGIGFATNGSVAAGQINKNATYGLAMSGITGTAHDFTIFENDGGNALTLTTGTPNWVFYGAVSGITTLAGTGAISGFTSLALSAGISGVTTLAGTGAISGFTSITLTGLIQTTLTTEQLRLRYDSANYCSVTVGADGTTTFDSVDDGSTGAFVFSDTTDFSAGLTTTTMTASSTIAVAGASINTDYAFNLDGTLAAGGAVRTTMNVRPVLPSSTTDSAVFNAGIRTAAASFTLTSGWGLYVAAPTVGAGSAITNMYGITIEELAVAGVTNAYGLNVTNAFRTDWSATATHTRMLVYDVDNATLERVTVGAADTGGSGFKVLRIPN